jgi:transposase
LHDLNDNLLSPLMMLWTAVETDYQDRLHDLPPPNHGSPNSTHIHGTHVPVEELVGIEACASSHHWSRELQALGHTVRLMPPAYVKPYVKSGVQRLLTLNDVIRLLRSEVKRAGSQRAFASRRKC